MNKKTLSTRAIAYVALFIAMQLVLEVLFKVIPGQPQGGSITLSLLPIRCGRFIRTVLSNCSPVLLLLVPA